MKNTPVDILILHKCNKSQDHMLYCSWDVVCDRCNCHFSYWAFFCPFTPLTAQKIKNKKKWNKHLEISSFYICVLKIMIRWCTVPEIWCATDGRTDGQTEKVAYRGGCPTLIWWNYIIKRKNKLHHFYWKICRETKFAPSFY